MKLPPRFPILQRTTPDPKRSTTPYWIAIVLLLLCNIFSYYIGFDKRYRIYEKEWFKQQERIWALEDSFRQYVDSVERANMPRQIAPGAVWEPGANKDNAPLIDLDSMVMGVRKR